MRKYFVWPLGAIALVMLAFALRPAGAQNSSSAAAAPPTKIKESFTLTAVGDILEHTPLAEIAEPGFQNFVKLMRGADATVANMEAPVADSTNPMGRQMRGFALSKTVVPDIKAMGVRMMNHANNHTLDFYRLGAAGMYSTIAALDEAGIVHAGSGRDLQEARAARFLSTPKGVVGLVGIFAIDVNQQPEPTQYSGATYSVGDVTGAPGANGLHMKTYYNVTPDQFKELRKIRDSVYAHDEGAPANESQDRIDLFNTLYKVGGKPGDISYTMDPGDLKEILRSIRNGKIYSDFMVVVIHAHQYSSAFQKYSADPSMRESAFDNSVPDFLVDLAHQAIDNGADAFVGHGVHTLRGVEIYKGKPIYYGLSNFIFQSPQVPSRGDAELPPTGPLTDAQIRGQAGWGPFGFPPRPNNLETLLVTSHYEGGRLTEMRLYPADLGQDPARPISRWGVPMTPAPETARQILQKVQTLSKLFGTNIAIENNVGVIRVSAQPQAAKK